MNQRERGEWINRAKERVLANAKATDSYVRDIMDLYDETAALLEREIEAMFQRYAGKEGLTYAEAEKLLTGEEYSRWRKSIDRYVAEARTDSRTLRELNTLSAKSRISRKEQLLSNIYRNMISLSGDTETKLTELLKDRFQVNYYRGCYDIQSVLKVGFPVSKIDEGMLKRILEYPWSGENYSQALWGNTDRLAAVARREITMGFMSGASVQKTAKFIDGIMERGRYAAERLVRTESSYFSNQGELASYRELGVEEYIYMGGGCEICAQLGGRSFRLDEAEAGTNLPPMHPNCKCTIVAKPKIDLFKNRDGAEPLKDNPKFEEWKKKYVKSRGLSASVGDPKNGVETHEEKKHLGNIDYHDAKVVKSTLEKYTERIVKDKLIENAVCITKSGDVYHCKGVADYVYPDYDLGDALAEAYVTHNHPISETHFSFSSADISLFMEYKLRELIGVDEKYTYVIRRTEKTTYADGDTLAHEFKGENYWDFLQEVFEGHLDADTDEYHYHVRRLAEQYGFEYERTKR